MEDYEINDIRNRRRVVPPLINVDTEIRHKIVIYLKITNIGALPAEDVTFEFSDTPVWRENKEPLTCLPTGQSIFPLEGLFIFGITRPQKFLRKIAISHQHWI
jgi:hypothetical protein